MGSNTSSQESSLSDDSLGRRIDAVPTCKIEYTWKVTEFTRKNLCLADKVTKPGEYFKAFCRLSQVMHLEPNGGRNSLKSFKSYLPPDEIIVIHDISESYGC